MAFYITTDVDSWAGNVGDRIPEFIAPDNPGTGAANRTLGGLHSSGGGSTSRGQWNEISDDYAFSGTKSIKLIFNPHGSNEPNDNKAGIFAGSSNRPTSGTTIWSSVWAYIPSSVPSNLGGSGGAGRKFTNVQYTGRTTGGSGRPLAYGSTIERDVCYYGGRLSSGSFSYYCSSSSRINTTPRSCANHRLPRGQWFNMQSITYHHTSNGYHRIIKDGVVIWNHTGINTLAADSTNVDPYYFGYPPVLHIFRNAGSSSFAWTMYIDDLILTDDPTYATATNDMGDPMLPMVPLDGSDNGSGNGGGEPAQPLEITDFNVRTSITAAALTWKTNKPANAVVDYGITENRGTWARGDDNTEDHVVELNDLTPGTTYYYRYSSKSADGDTVFDENNSTFTTKEQGDTTKPVISGVSATPGVTNATVTWTTNEASSSTVEYGESGRYGKSAAGEDDTIKHSVVIAGLTEGTQYHYRVKSADASGNEAVSDDATFTTQKGQTPTVNLDDLNDVDTASVTDGQVLVRKGDRWVNGNISVIVDEAVKTALKNAKITIG